MLRESLRRDGQRFQEGNSEIAAPHLVLRRLIESFGLNWNKYRKLPKMSGKLGQHHKGTWDRSEKQKHNKNATPLQYCGYLCSKVCSNLL